MRAGKREKNGINAARQETEKLHASDHENAPPALKMIKVQAVRTSLEIYAMIIIIMIYTLPF